MTNYITVILDTTAPSTPSLILEGGATYATESLIQCTIGTIDESTTGYQMKIWGDVDEGYDGSVKATEQNSSWITYSTTKQIRLSSGDGQKVIYLKIRDDVHNESAIVNSNITFDETRPMVSVTTADVSKISKIEGKNTVNFSFTSDTPYVEYLVKAVNSTGASYDLGTTIPTTNGSVNTNGTGMFDTVTPITVTINGADLELANSGDGTKIIKVFVRDNAGLWSV